MVSISRLFCTLQSRKNQREKFSHLKRIVDCISVTSNAGHRLAFIVASQCFNRPLNHMLKAHFTALQYTDFSEVRMLFVLLLVNMFCPLNEISRCRTCKNDGRFAPFEKEKKLFDDFIYKP